MSRISQEFLRLQQIGTKGFIPFVTAGDPDLETSLEIVLKLAELGASVIELGVPFSDPMADGPTIQLSSQRALRNGVNLSKIFELIIYARKKTDVPIVLFSYLNPLLQFGLEKLAKTAAEVGVDGVLITDVIDTEASEIADLLKEKSLDLISLIAPTTMMHEWPALPVYLAVLYTRFRAPELRVHGLKRVQMPKNWFREYGSSPICRWRSDSEFRRGIRLRTFGVTPMLPLWVRQ